MTYLYSSAKPCPHIYKGCDDWWGGSLYRGGAKHCCPLVMYIFSSKNCLLENWSLDLFYIENRNVNTFLISATFWGAVFIRRGLLLGDTYFDLTIKCCGTHLKTQCLLKEIWYSLFLLHATRSWNEKIFIIKELYQWCLNIAISHFLCSHIKMSFYKLFFTHVCKLL